MNTIKARVLQILSESSNDTAVELIADTHQFKANLGLDSLDLVELPMLIEDEFGIEISDEEEAALFTPTGTVGQLVNWVEAAVASKEAATAGR